MMTFRLASERELPEEVPGTREPCLREVDVIYFLRVIPLASRSFLIRSLR